MNWTLMSSASVPKGRHGHTMLYDQGRDRTILFGGYAIDYCNDTWTYDLKSNAWSNVTSSVSPPARLYHTAAYDSKSGKMVVFGGTDAKSLFNDTWIYDPASNSWKNASPPKSPSPRERAGMAYDSESGRVVLFGGWTGKGYTNETWMYDVQNSTWKNMTFLTNPKARASHALAYDSQSDRIVLFGGKTSALVFSDETWSYDLNINKWTNVTTASRPKPKAGHALAYDSKADRIVMFGGMNTNETWSYDPGSNAWTLMKPASSPFARSEHAMSYDASGERIVLFGGDMGGDEAWLFDSSRVTWTNTNPNPSSRLGHALAYDSGRDSIVLFGGAVTGLTLAGDTWSYDLGANAWKNMNPVSRPSPRSSAAMAYDSRHGRIVLFGGTTAPSQFSNETWAYDLGNNTWTDKRPQNPPQARAYHALAYDSESDRIVLFGGNTDNGTWAYDLNNNTWEKRAPAAGPSARSLPSMSYDSESDRIVLFGGNASGANSNETWAYDYNNDTWQDMGPVLAPGAREGHAMTYSSAVDRVVTFGGWSAGSYNNETWTYDYDKNRWERIDTLTAPTPRARSGMAYDSKSGSVVLFGGMTASEPRNGETWTCWPPGNVPPSAPKMSGPSVGLKDVSLAFSVSSTDGDQDDVRYIVDWGDGKKDSTSYYASGKTVNLSHAWTSVGMYDVRAKAIDSRGTESTWSAQHQVSITAPPAPIVRSTTPANGDVNVALNTAIRINFSRMMNTTATVGAMTIVPDVYLSSKWYEQDTLLELTPPSPLVKNTTYTITISTGAESKDGAHLASSYNFSFKTADKSPPPPPPPPSFLGILVILIVFVVAIVIAIAALSLRRKKRRVRRHIKD